MGEDIPLPFDLPAVALKIDALMVVVASSGKRLLFKHGHPRTANRERLFSTHLGRLQARQQGLLRGNSGPNRDQNLSAEVRRFRSLAESGVQSLGRARTGSSNDQSPCSTSKPFGNGGRTSRPSDKQPEQS
jgi:hypothetical protein